MPDIEPAESARQHLHRNTHPREPELQRSVLLGNGFSRAYDEGVFSYASLVANATFGCHTDALARLFARLNSRDFEFAVSVLESSRNVLASFAGGDVAANPPDADLQGAAETLRRQLGAAVIASHPIASTVLTDDQCSRCSTFLDPFDRLFTTNYDLLLYWVCVKDRNNLNSRWRDGFGWNPQNMGKLYWPSIHSQSQTIFYLHGALHLYRHPTLGIEKLIVAQGGPPLVDQIRTRVNGGEFPLIVAEGSSAQKLGRIYSNGYLSHCYQSLIGLKGTLATVGFGFSDADLHIRHAIVNSRIHTLWIGCHGEAGSPVPAHTELVATSIAEQREAVNAPARQHNRQTSPLTIRFFSTLGLHIWR